MTDLQFISAVEDLDRALDRFLAHEYPTLALDVIAANPFPRSASLARPLIRDSLACRAAGGRWVTPALPEAVTDLGSLLLGTYYCAADSVVKLDRQPGEANR